VNDTNELITRAFALAIKASGQMALALAARRLAPGAPSQWAKALRDAAALLSALPETTLARK
jgi:hypothetical protein